MRNLLGLVLPLLSSCLLIGAPNVFLFKSKKNLTNTIKLSSYSSGTMYSYKVSGKYDSVILSIDSGLTYKKMDYYSDGEYTFSQKEQRENVKKLGELKKLYLKRYFKTIVTYDTLFKVSLAGARVPRVQ